MTKLKSERVDHTDPLGPDYRPGYDDNEPMQSVMDVEIGLSTGQVLRFQTVIHGKTTDEYCDKAQVFRDLAEGKTKFIEWVEPRTQAERCIEFSNDVWVSYYFLTEQMDS